MLQTAMFNPHYYRWREEVYREGKGFVAGHIGQWNCPGLLTPSPVPVHNTMQPLFPSCFTQFLFRKSNISHQSGLLSKREDSCESPLFTVDCSSILPSQDTVHSWALFLVLRVKLRFSPDHKKK